MRARKGRSFRSWLSVMAAALAAASGLAVVGAISVGAEEAAITIAPASGSPIGETMEGDSTGLTRVAKFIDSDNTGPNTNCTSTLYTATIHWGDGKSSTGTVACEYSSITTARIPLGVFDVGGSHTYLENDSYTISVTVTDTEESETSATVNSDTASISDANLETDPDFSTARGPFAQVEGAPVALSVNFFDNNNAYPVTEGPAFDSGITATINWGDGSAVQTGTVTAPQSSCDCSGDFVVSATHVYDAPKQSDASYTITVTATDDGGKSATDTLKATISDGTLSKDGATKSVVAQAGQISNAVLASFKDTAAGQAKAADFGASIKWGDGATSSGTVSQTAVGAFNVSGTHSYATAGTKALTITVTDEEGATLSIAATATVPPLPTTGQPSMPGRPATPLPLLGIVLGLMAIAFGAGHLLLRRLRS